MSGSHGRLYYPEDCPQEISEPAHCLFDRKEPSKCLDQNVFRDYSVHANLPMGEEYVVEITPEQGRV